MASRECPECKGEGKTTEIDIMKAKSVVRKCETCNGEGIIKERDGIFFEVLKGKPMFIELYEKDRLVSWAKIRFIPVIAQDTGERHCVVEIDHIETKKGFRRKGKASRLIDAMKNMAKGEVKYILTHWKESTPESKAMLSKNGFTRKGQHLVWKRSI